MLGAALEAMGHKLILISPWWNVSLRFLKLSGL